MIINFLIIIQGLFMTKCSRCGDTYNESISSKCPNCGNDVWNYTDIKKANPNKAIRIVFALVFISVVCIFLIQNFTKKKVSDEVYETGAYVIKVVDLYIDGNATREETEKKIHEINFYCKNDEELKSITFEMEFIEYGLKRSDIPQVKKYRDEIAKTIGY